MFTLSSCSPLALAQKLRVSSEIDLTHENPLGGDPEGEGKPRVWVSTHGYPCVEKDKYSTFISVCTSLFQHMDAAPSQKQNCAVMQETLCYNWSCASDWKKFFQLVTVSRHWSVRVTLTFLLVSPKYKSRLFPIECALKCPL